MPTQETVIWIARLIAAGFAWMVCWPPLLLLLGLRRYRGGTYGGPDDLTPISAKPNSVTIACIAERSRILKDQG